MWREWWRFENELGPAGRSSLALVFSYQMNVVDFDDFNPRQSVVQKRTV